MLSKSDKINVGSLRWHNGILTNIDNTTPEDHDKQKHLEEFFSEDKNEQIYGNLRDD